MMKNSYSNLKKYIAEDISYQKYKENGSTKGLSDFDLYCVEHCQDIENILNENSTNDKLLAISVQKLLDIQTYCMNTVENDISNDILDIINKGDDEND